MLLWKKSRISSKKIITPLSEEHNLHKSLRYVLTIAQVFGYFPVQGVLKESVTSLGFKWFSLRVLSSIVTIIFGTLIVIGHLRHIIYLGYDQFDMNGIIFYACGTLSCLCFIKMAREWQTIMLKWQEVDYSMFSYGWPRTLNRRLKIMSFIFLFLEMVEHVSIQTNKLIVSVQCRGSLSKGFEHFSVNMSFYVIFDIIKPFYGAWLGVFLQIINSRMAFSWTFIDLFIILISCALALRFRQINCRVRSLKEMKVQSERSWASVNDDYNRLCRLCRFTDDKMSWIILVSFFNNFYFIIFHVFDSISLHEATTLETVYYYIALCLLILRIVSICLYGNWVHEESKKPLNLLAAIPQEIYNREIRRFLDSVKYQTMGLTGKKFFWITKKLILQITSAVVTYELVVIQFNKSLPPRETPSKNSIC